MINLMHFLSPYLSSQVLSQLDRLLNSSLEVKGLVTDNRDVKPGDCFIAIAGITHHGKEFIDDAIARGASAVLVEEDTSIVETRKSGQEKNIPIVPFSDLKKQLNTLLINFYKTSSSAFDMRLLGVTGTNGKSSITRFVAQMSHGLNQPAGLMGTLGFGTWPNIAESKNTTPELAVLLRQFVLMKEQGAELVAMEVSSHGIEQKRIEGLTFDSAVFANLSQDHLDYHCDMESYFAIKRELFIGSELQYAIINADDEYGQRLIADDAICAKKISYGFANSADVRVISWQMHATSIDAVITTPWGDASFTINMLGDFNLANVLAAITLLAVEDKFDFQQIISSIQFITPAPGRMQAYSKSEYVPVVVDFAHTPDALKNVLSTLSKQVKGNLAVVFGCGGDRDNSKRPLMAAIAQEISDLVCFTADNPRHENLDAIIQEMQSGLASSGMAQVQVEKDRKKAIQKMISELTENDLLLIAGKGHEAYQDIAGQKIPYSDEDVLFALGYQESALNAEQTIKNDINKEALS
jgi:UDP-N-acetylmuramoyl-L-alanyl-D-glutamate--2,6-diaminopimelate ligase